MTVTSLDGAPRPRVTRRAEQLVVVGICVLGLALRLPGLTSGDLWADDAWLAMAARVPLPEVSHLTLTTPLLSYFLAGWIRLDPSSSWWAQLPGLLASIAAIYVVWLLAVEIGVGLFARLAVTLMAACSPGAVEYSLRIKEYPSELLIGALLLYGLARWRRTGHLVPLVWIGIGGALACFWSGSLIAFVGVLGIIIAVVGRRQRAAIGVAVVLFGSCAAAVLSYLSHLPPRLNVFWAPQELHGVGGAANTSRNLALIGTGVAHGLAGVPLLVGRFPLVLALTASQIRLGELEALLEVLGLLAGLVAVVALVRRRVEPAGTVGVAALGIIGAAIGGAVLGRSPLGGGRTDLWWYPAAWVLSALVLDAVARRMPAYGTAGSLARGGGIAVLACIALIGVLFPAWYPHENVRAARAAIGERLGPDAAVVVAGRIPFTWAYEGVGPFRIVDATGARRPTNGFAVAVSQPHGVEASIVADPSSACHRFTGVFVFTSDDSLASPSAYRIASPAAFRLNSTARAVVDSLEHHGWRVTTTWRSPGVVVLEMHHHGVCGA